MSLAVPASASAADELPVTGEVITLPGSSYGAIVGDLDGDGVREVVRIVRAAVGGELLVEAWRDDADAWRSLGAVALRRGAVVDELIKRFGDADEMRPLHVNEPAALFAWDRAGSERILVATIGQPNLGPPCCLTLFELEVGADERLRLRLLPGPIGNGFGTASDVHAVDLDLDGTDELVVTDSTDPGGGTTVHVLRWAGTRFEVVEPSITTDWTGASPSYAWPMGLADLDGAPGEEMLFQVQRAEAEEQLAPNRSILLRLRATSAAPVLDVAEIDGWPLLPAEAAVNRFVATTDEFGRARAFAWPAGEAPRIGPEYVGRASEVMGTVGEGEDGFFLAWESAAPAPFRSAELTLLVLGSDFQVLERVEAAPSARLVTEDWIYSGRFDVAAALAWPYQGSLPGGDQQARPAYLWSGRLVSGSGERVEVQEVTPLFGASPVGLAGRDRNWLVAASTPGSFTNRGYGGLYRGPNFDLRLMPSSRWLGTDRSGVEELEDALQNVQLRGAALGADDGGTIYTSEDEFTVDVPTPAGSRLVGTSSNRPLQADEDETTGMHRLEIARPQLIRARGWDLAVMVISADGEAAVRVWQVVLLEEAPTVEASEETVPFDLTATISGQASLPATVLIDGKPVAVGEDGAFAVEVSAAPWPREVRVEVVDPLGRRAVQVLSVVGLLDYRGWPWVGIVAVLTVLAGAVLFLRAGSLHRGRSVDRGIATLEEIER